MGQRHDKTTHASKRRREETLNATPSARTRERDERVPLAGHESLYEITRDGRIYSLKTHAFLAAGYAHSAFVRFPVSGAVVSLPKDAAVAASWGAKTPEPAVAEAGES